MISHTNNEKPKINSNQFNRVFFFPINLINRKINKMGIPNNRIIYIMPAIMLH